MRHILLRALLLLLYPVVCSGQWVTPLGIPAPAFGITETAPARPSPWTSDQAGYGYVEAGGSCSDTNTWGNPTAARCTIPQALAAGEVWELHGTYATSHTGGSAQFLVTGTAESPVWIRGQDCNTKPTVTNRWELTGTYAIIECINGAATAGGKYQFDLTGSTVGGTSHHLALRNSTISGNDTNGGLTTGGLAHNIVFYGLTESAIGDYDGSLGIPDQDFHGISVGCCAHDVWIVDNDITTTSGDCVQINAGVVGDMTDVYNIFVSRNVIHACRQNGLWSKYAGAVFYTQNTGYGFSPTSTGQGACYGSQYGTAALWIVNNSCTASEAGVIIASDDGMQGTLNHLIVGNIFVNLVDTDTSFVLTTYDTDAAILYRSDQNLYLVNNLIYNVPGHGLAIPGGATNAGHYVANNIMDTVVGRNFMIEILANATNITSGGNVFVADYDQNIAGSVSTVSAPTTFGNNNKSAAAAGFVNAGAGDFRLLPTSIARDIDTATLVPVVYASFVSSYSRSIQKTYDLRDKPFQVIYDAGPYEYIVDARIDVPFRLRF